MLVLCAVLLSVAVPLKDDKAKAMVACFSGFKFSSADRYTIIGYARAMVQRVYMLLQVSPGHGWGMGRQFAQAHRSRRERHRFYHKQGSCDRKLSVQRKRHAALNRPDHRITRHLLTSPKNALTLPRCKQTPSLPCAPLHAAPACTPSRTPCRTRSTRGVPYRCRLRRNRLTQRCP